MKTRPVPFFAVITFGLTILATILLWQYVSFDPVWSWLIAISAIAFFTFGYDKAIAGSKRTRVPEGILLALTFFGGTIGAVLGQIVFRHKTIKASFLVKFWILIAVQVALIVLYMLYIEPGPLRR
jgi:uncharacterized membrane protein YsdA (DUF1294 family)